MSIKRLQFEVKKGVHKALQNICKDKEINHRGTIWCKIIDNSPHKFMTKCKPNNCPRIY